MPANLTDKDLVTLSAVIEELGDSPALDWDKVAAKAGMMYSSSARRSFQRISDKLKANDTAVATAESGNEGNEEGGRGYSKAKDKISSTRTTRRVNINNSRGKASVGKAKPNRKTKKQKQSRALAKVEYEAEAGSGAEVDWEVDSDTNTDEEPQLMDEATKDGAKTDDQLSASLLGMNPEEFAEFGENPFFQPNSNDGLNELLPPEEVEGLDYSGFLGYAPTLNYTHLIPAMRIKDSSSSMSLRDGSYQGSDHTDS